MYYNKFSLGLSREVWLVQAGVFLNTLGWGAVLPFEVIYLHDGRGFSLGVAGLVVGTLTGGAVVSSPAAGPAIDRFGARATVVAASLALAAGYVGLAFATSAAAAFATAAVAGIGNGALNPSQSTLLAALAPPTHRHRATAVSRVAVNVGFGFGGALGGLVAAHGLNGLVVLLVANGATYLAYAGILVAVVRRPPGPAPLHGGYRLVLRDRALVHLGLTNAGIICVGWGVLPWVVPPFATDELHAGARLIGLLFLANAATVVVVQVPIARFAEGRRRVVMMAVAAAIFAATFALLLPAAHVSTPAADAMLVGAAVAIGVGECFHSVALMPLVADLAPPGLTGRYMAAIALSWWVGLALAPTLGTQLLEVSSTLALAGTAAVAAVAAGAALRLDRKLSDAARETPRPDVVPAPR